MKKIFKLILLLFIGLQASAQDIHFSQFEEAPLLLNPALTGYFDGTHRIGLNYKNQWKSVGDPYRTFSLGYDAGLNRGKSSTGYLALGLALYNDVAGDLKLSTLSGQLNLAYHLKINDDQTLAAGLYGGFGQRSIDQAMMQWDNQYDGFSGHDPSLPSGEITPIQNFSYVDFGFGMLWNLKLNATNMTSNDGFKANLGFSVSHVNQPALTFLQGSDEKMDMRISVHGRAQIGVEGSNMAFVPSMLFQMQGTQKEIVPGLMVRYQLREQSKYTGFINDAYLSVGGHFRVGDAVIIHALIELNDLALGISYDLNVSNLTLASSGKGGFEIALRYIITNPNSGNKSLY